MTSVFAIICTLVQLITGSAASSEVESLLWQPSYVVSLVSVSSIVCIIIIILACARWCPKETAEFQDFDNDGFFSDVNIQPPNNDIAMIPPVTDSEPNVPVVIEPLPNLATLRQHLQADSVTSATARVSSYVNASELRPKIAHIGHDRVDSDDEGDVLTNEALLLQERVSLEKLLSNTQHKLERHQLQYIREMGTSWFGKVLLADGQDILPGHTKSRVVIQALNENADQHTQYLFLQESAPYRDMDHANVLKIIGHCVEMAPFLTVLEPCPQGDLKSYLRSHRSDHDSIDKQGLLLNIACDMASGLQALHQSNYVHRDFALRNCLVSSDLTVKVGDYGLAEEFYKDDYFIDTSNNAVPLRWLAPEVVEPLNGSVVLRHITKDCNLWSFGVALWELVTFGGLPYNDLTNSQVIRQVIVDGNVRLSQPEVPVSNLEQLYQLMSLCWLAPAQRPSLRELRIMLLQLLDLRSSRDELEAAEFDRRWSQLMPRSPAAITATLPPVIADDDDDLSPSVMPKHSAVDVHSPVLPMVFNLTGSGMVAMVRPASADSEFSSELNASLSAQPGSLQTSLHSVSTSPGNTPDDFAIDESFMAMSPHFLLATTEHPHIADIKATTSSSSAFEMISYNKPGKAEITEVENKVKANVDVIVSENSPEMLPSTSALPVEPAINKETTTDRLDSVAEDLSSNQNMNNSSTCDAEQQSAMINKTEGDEVSANVTNDVVTSGMEESEKNGSTVEDDHDTESDAVGKEQTDSKDGSFCMLKVSVDEDDSLTKSLDFESPAKSTTSSADWCLVSNHTEHSREEELDTVSHVTDPSLPSDCVLVENKEKDTPDGSMEEVSNADIISADVHEQAAEYSTEQPIDDTTQH